MIFNCILTYIYRYILLNAKYLLYTITFYEYFFCINAVNSKYELIVYITPIKRNANAKNVKAWLLLKFENITGAKSIPTPEPKYANIRLGLPPFLP